MVWKAVFISALMLAGAAAEARVRTGDTFSFVMLAGADDGTVYQLGDAQLVTFGQARSFSSYEGQIYTITSSQTVTPTVSTVSFGVSTDAGFLLSPTIDRKKITILAMNFGTTQSGAGLPGGRELIDFYKPMGDFTRTAIYSYAGGAITAVTTGAQTTPGLEFFGFAKATNDLPISSVGLRAYTAEYVYASAVPEPATWAMMIIGFGMAGSALRRRPAAAPSARRAT